MFPTSLLNAGYAASRVATLSRASLPITSASPALFSNGGRRLYHEKVIDHYEKPRNVGSLPKSDPDVGTGLVGAPACGDVMRLQIRVDSEDRIVDARFKTFGCGSAIASSSLVTEMVRGLSLDEAAGIKNSAIANELCLPPVKLHCSMLAEDAIKAAISDFMAKRKARSSSS